MKAYDEEVNLKTTEGYIIGNGLQGTEINVGLGDQESIKTILPQIKKKYEDQVIVQQNTMYYYYNGKKSNKERVKWCFEAGIPVWGYDSWEEFEELAGEPASKGEYIKVGNTYCCAPDLTGFNVSNTYYVTYDGDNEIIGDKIYKDKPKDWYDYSQQKWANVVTINGDKLAYFTWIPRYVYLIDEEAATNQSPKIKFVDKQNNYKDGITEQVTNYPDRSINTDENGVQTNYVLPEAFKFENTELAGYWVSKYEVSEVNIQYLMKADKNKITVEKVGKKGLDTINKYEIYVDNVLRNTVTEFPYEITGLTADTEYQIKIVTKAVDGDIITTNIDKVKTLEDDMANLTNPDLTGFNPDTTYYVTYDDDGNEDNSIPISEAQPNGWYDYGNKKWANIVTKDGNKLAYFTWIPRYEYKIKSILEEVEIRFMSVNQKEASNSQYRMSSAFKWDGKDIPGYWVSKYEVSLVDIEYLMDAEKNQITIARAGQKGLDSIGAYKIYVDGNYRTTVTSLPYTITSLTTNTEYRIKVVAQTSGGVDITAREEKVKTLEDDIAKLTKPDLTGFNTSKTYYVTYDDSGNEDSSVPISSAAPTNWYDYKNKKWANIVTKDGDKLAYFTWIPRYEYKIREILQETEIRFISTKQKTASNEEYKLPESFKWGGEDIAGYWVSKYEVSKEEETTP